MAIVILASHIWIFASAKEFVNCTENLCLWFMWENLSTYVDIWVQWKLCFTKSKVFKLHEALRSMNTNIWRYYEFTKPQINIFKIDNFSIKLMQMKLALL